MATPANDALSCASGGRVAAGRHFVSAFYRGLAPGWTELVIPGLRPGGGILAYSGMALDEDGGKLYVIGGGHQDAPNDEPYCLDIEARLEWTKPYNSHFGQNPPLASAQAVTDNVNWPGAIVLGGVPVKPISRHTYRTVHWIRSLQRVSVGGGSTYSGSGSDYLWLGQPGGGAWLNAPNDFWFFNPFSKSFEYKGSKELNPAYDIAGSVMLYDDGRDLIYNLAVNGNNSLNMRAWNPQANNPTLYPTWAAGNTSTERFFCNDTIRDKLLIVSRNSLADGMAEVWEFDKDTHAFTQLPSTGDRPSNIYGDPQVVHSPETDRIILLQNSANGMYFYDRKTGVWTHQAVTLPGLLQVEGRWVYDKRRKCAFLVYYDQATGVRTFVFKE